MATRTNVTILGSLEAEIMPILWCLSSVTVKEVHRVIARRRAEANREIAYTTVLTTMNRLAEKGLIEREQSRGSTAAYRYHAAVTREELAVLAVRAVATELLGGDARVLLSALGAA